VPQDDADDHECGIMTSDVDTDHGEGFVCERVTRVWESSSLKMPESRNVCAFLLEEIKKQKNSESG